MSQVMTKTLCALAVASLSAGAFALPYAQPISQPLIPPELAIVVNDLDPNSVAIGEAYRAGYNIPVANVLHVKFKPGATNMPKAEFNLMRQTLEASVPKQVQGYLLTWNAPYMVDKMSITSAFAFGYDPKWTSAYQCATTAVSPYFNSDGVKPTDLKMRLAMTLGVQTPAEAAAMVARNRMAGIPNTSSGSPSVGGPIGKAYLMSTTDQNRNVRSYEFTNAQMGAYSWMPTEIVYANALLNKQDVMFEFTGIASISAANLASSKFLPGAIADHLTSYGGKLTDSSQMSVLKWIQAGASGSYGTVVEPCNYGQKFPKPQIVMNRYLSGETLMQAYWKSVQWPGEGIFVGDPLVKPFAFKASRTRIDPKYGLVAEWPAMKPGYYKLESSIRSNISPSGLSYRTLGNFYAANNMPVGIVLKSLVNETDTGSLRVTWLGTEPPLLPASTVNTVPTVGTGAPVVSNTGGPSAGTVPTSTKPVRAPLLPTVVYSQQPTKWDYNLGKPIP